MKKSSVNFIIDAVMMLLMAAIVGIGLLLNYVLVHGRDVPEKYGFNADLYLFGMDRVLWGDIHLVLGLILLGLVFLHIILHWPMIKALYRNLIASPGVRRGTAAVFTAATVFLFLFFIFFPPEFRVFERGGGRGRYQETSGGGPGVVRLAMAGQADQERDSVAAAADTVLPGDSLEREKQPAEAARPGRAAGRPRRQQQEQDEQCLDEQQGDSSVEVNGQWTLSEVAHVYDVPMDVITWKLGLPRDIPSASRLGRLRRTYGFRMSDIERAILEYRQSGAGQRQE